MQMHGVDYLLEPGDELFIPRGAPFTRRNSGEAPADCLLGFD
jgi:mannose-6-phosphate isomerase-like protein (cupin superfamily)